MIPTFADKSVGCVTGRVIYQDDKDSNVGAGTQSYWNYEFFLKKHEKRGLLADRRLRLHVRGERIGLHPLYNEACSDFIIATTMVEQGLRAVYVPEAVCTEEPNRRRKRAGGARPNHLADVCGPVAEPWCIKSVPQRVLRSNCGRTS